MGLFGSTNPVQGIAGLGAAAAHAAKEAQRKEAKRPTEDRRVERTTDSVEFEDAAHRAKEDPQKRRGGSPHSPPQQPKTDDSDPDAPPAHIDIQG
jgi:hypothetical protein